MSAFIDTDLTDATVARAREGDAVAQEQVYRAFERPVRTLARRLLANRAAAEDVAQDVFIDVLTRLHQFEGRGSFAGWVRSIAVTRCLMHLRSPWQRSRRWLAQPAADAIDADGWCEHAATPGSGGRSDQAAVIDLERALATLSDTARAVVWLHDVEGYTHGEIAVLFGATASFSKSQLARAHERLRTALQSEGVGNACMPVSSTY
jgi:RNA polymerase sigma-70 factor (ECF subfamily)